jgi:type VI secretion system secreted protein VgrG
MPFRFLQVQRSLPNVGPLPPMKAEISFLTPFGAGLSQHARLITLASAQQRCLPESLVAEQFTGREAVNALFSFDVEALSVSTTWTCRFSSAKNSPSP